MKIRRSFVDALRIHLVKSKNKYAFTFLRNGEEISDRLTYADLDRRSRAIAGRLQEEVEEGQCVLLLFPPGLEFITAFLGCLYAGVIAIPAYPPGRSSHVSRLSKIIVDARPAAIVTTSIFRSRIETWMSRIPSLEDVRILITGKDHDADPELWQPRALNSDSPAFLQYTSGSTMNPRGVVVTHGNLLHNEEMIRRAFEQDESSVIVSWLPTYHDMGLIGGVLQPIYLGASCFLMSPVAFIRKPVRWLQAIDRHRATTSGGPNFAYDICVRKIRQEERAQLDLTTWRVAFSGAEPVRAETLQRFIEVFGSCGFRRKAFYPCYGLAEATLFVSGGKVKDPPIVAELASSALQEGRIRTPDLDESGQLQVGCGKTAADQEILIVDPETQTARSADRVGEIWLRGPSVANGYWNNPQMTERVFRAQIRGEAGTYLRTGDLGFVRDGELFITGRLKDLIILRGRNYYPQDIESIAEQAHADLVAGAGVAFSVVVEGQEALIVGFEVSPSPATEVDQKIEEIATAVRRAIMDELEIVVREVVLLPRKSIPRTSSGKIQRQLCRRRYLEDKLKVVGRQVAPGTRRPQGDHELPGGAPGMPSEFDLPSPKARLEEVLLEEIEVATGVAAAGIDRGAPLIALGLDSLGAAELAQSLEEKLAIKLSLAEMLDGMTLSDLFNRIQRAAAEGEQQRPAPGRSFRETSEYPLSEGQRALWFLHRLAPDLGVYNISAAGRIRSPIDVEALRQAWRLLQQRHPALRTTIRSFQGELRQRVNRDPEAELDLEEAAGWTAAQLHEELGRRAARPFHLEAGPLCRAVLYRCGPQESVLLIVVHHIIADFTSMAVIAKELGTLYAALTQDEAVVADTLATPARSYAEHIVNSHRRLTGGEGRKLLAFWRQELAGAPIQIDLPTDRPRPPVQTFRGATNNLHLEAALAARLNAVAQEQGVTLFTLLLTAFQTLLHRYTGQLDFLLGTPAEGRDEPGLQHVVGYFVNPVVLRADATQDPSFEEFLARTWRTVLNAFAHWHYPFPLLTEKLQPERDASSSPLFQVMFTLFRASPVDGPGLAASAVGKEGIGLQLGGLEFESVGLRETTSPFDLTLRMAALPPTGTNDASFLASFQYNPDLFDATSITRLAGHYRVLLTSLGRDSARSLSQLQLLPDGERQQLLVEWNVTEKRIPGACVHQLFERQTLLTPDAVALTDENQSWSYRELGRRTHQMAHHLRALGVGPEVRVGLCLERSAEMVIALWGVLEAGGAYVPLDPAYPEERLRFILEDADVEVLITQSGLLSRVSDFAPQLICIDHDPSTIWRRSTTVPVTNVSAENLAYLIYTSGSTGQPKGVQISHGALVNFFDSMLEQPGMDAQDVILAVTTLSFDIAGVELVLPLLCGARVIVASHQTAISGARLRKKLDTCTVMQATPATWRMLLESGWRGNQRLRLLCGGEALPADLAAELLDRGSELWNLYGPTETTIWSTLEKISSERHISIGWPLLNTRIDLLDPRGYAVAIGGVGELGIGGVGLARGYLNQPALSAEKFVPDFYAGRPGGRLYRTGDLARRFAGGRLEYLGRRDHQVKLRGFRIELAEIEAILRAQPEVQEAVVTVWEPETGDQRLIAYLVSRESQQTADRWRLILRQKVPEWMVPYVFVFLDALPLTPSGKVDRQALPPPGSAAPAAGSEPESRPELALADLWREVLGLNEIGIDQNFFDLGGHSLLMARLQALIQEKLGWQVTLTDLLRYPTIRSLARQVDMAGTGPAETAESSRPVGKRRAFRRHSLNADSDEVAVIGMAGRFPGARDPQALWQNLARGVESIRSFSDAELAVAGVDRERLADPRYVRAGATIDDIDLFDASYFDFSPQEAKIMDPQHRLFLQAAVTALENAGYDPRGDAGAIGVYAGAGINTYLIHQLLRQVSLEEPSEAYPLMLGNDKDYLATRVSYKLGLGGPSVVVQSACSTSLVAVHLACQSLLRGECDIALAGGVSIAVPQETGYLYQEGMILSDDGHCRAFDARAGGTVRGSGLGIVVLKSLAAARADGDHIRAVIRGSAINNDGAHKIGYTAPSVERQAAVIAEALDVAGIAPDTLSYVEGHGTGTALGDPVEVAALTRAFREQTERVGFCALGSIKTNLGHLDAAAGVAGLIKTVLALEQRQIPPSLHFEAPNPRLELESSPFYIPHQLQEWPTREGERRAGVSSFGIGGTNAHVLVEEAPSTEKPAPSRPVQLLVLSAKTETALAAVSQNLTTHLADNPDLNLPDAAFTLQVGRTPWRYRRVIVCGDRHEAQSALTTQDPACVFTAEASEIEPRVAFLFPGQGSQYLGMGHELYASEESFRLAVDGCAELFKPHLGLDLRELIHSADITSPQARETLKQTWLTQPALFTVEYAVARQLMDWGVEPDGGMLGHSLGEYVAACLAGVFSLEDAVALVAERGRLLQELPEGAMLSVGLPPEELQPWLGQGLSIAAINGPRLTTVAGLPAALGGLAAQLAARRVEHRRLETARAFHSEMTDPIVERFGELVSGYRLAPPKRPFFSNVSGDWIRDSEATDPAYWARHIRATVQFSPAVKKLLARPDRVMLEVGPGWALTALVKQHLEPGARVHVFPTLRRAKEATRGQSSDLRQLLTALGRLWSVGGWSDWQRFYRTERRLRVELPTYPFEGQRFWVDARPRPPELPDAIPGERAWVIRTEEKDPKIHELLKQLEQRGVQVTELDSERSPQHGEPGLQGAQTPATRSPHVHAPDSQGGELRAIPFEPVAPPRTATEERLAKIWTEVLGVAGVGRNDDFFALGGHSLLATQLASRIAQDLRVELSIAAVLEAPTVAEQATLVDRSTDAQALPVRLSPRRRLDGDEPLELSFAQERIWFLDRLHRTSSNGSGRERPRSEDSFYNLVYGVEVTGSLKIAALEASLNEIVRRHQVLRTYFPEIEGEPRQTIAPSFEIPLPIVDLQGCELSVRQRLARELRTAAARRSFDLTTSPLLRILVLRLDDDHYELIFNLHHIIADGWSMGILVRELITLYQTSLAEQTSPLPKLDLQYADFAVWQRRILAGESLEKELLWWRQELAGAPHVLDLPTDFPRPPAQTFRGAVERFVLPPSLTWKLKRLSRSRGATLFTTLLAAFETLLARWSGQRDLLIGTPIANRNHAEIEDLIGLFVNTLVMRGDLRGAPSFSALLERIKTKSLDAYAHQDLPLEKLVDDLQRERDLSRSPLFQVMFALQNTPLPELELAGLALNFREIETGVAKFDLELSLEESADALQGKLAYSVDLFAASTVRRMILHFERLLTAIVEDPRQPALAVPILSPGEEHQLVREWNASAAPYPPEVPLHQLVTSQAERAPDTIALAFETGDEFARALPDSNHHLSYGELHGRSNQLAWRLRSLGVEPETRVAISLERSLELVIGLLGILKAGGAYVPLDPSYPEERRAFMLEDSAAVAIVGQWKSADASLARVELGEGWTLGEQSRENLPPVALSDNLAYVIHTSGSTGWPKGAMNSHRAICNRLIWMQEQYRLNDSDRVLQKTPISFDVSVWEFFWPLLVGARLVLARPGAHGDSEYLVRLMARHQITTVHFVPAMLEGFLSEPEISPDSGLRRIIASGEALAPSLVQKFVRLGLPKAQLHNLYGPTEAAVDVTFHACGSEEPQRGVPIGRPIANTSIHLLDDRIAPVPIGVAGHLHIGGIQVTRGYLGRPRLTAQTLIPDPLSEVPGQRLYRTGDLARWLPEGEIVFLGRIDHQIKLRGLRIELGEVESALRDHPAIHALAVVVTAQQLVAWVVLEPLSRTLTAENIEAFLHRRLPEFMVPSRFQFCERFPLLPNGKVDRRTLASHELPALPSAGGQSSAPRNPVEELLSQIWADVLEVERVGWEDHFFHLGGHSLLATRMVSRVRSVLGVEIELRTVFEAPRLGELAARIEAAKSTASSAALPPLERIARDRPLPLSFAQERLWLIDQLDPGNTAYNISVAVRLDGALEVPALVASLNEIVRRHEILRTTLIEIEGEPHQRIANSLAVALPTVDLSAVGRGERGTLAQALAATEAGRSFDLRRGPLLRVLLLQLHSEEHCVVLHLHHVIFDGWSIEVLAKELQALYQAAVEGRPSRLPPLEFQYADFAVWQRQWLTGEVLEKELDWWRDRLADAPQILELPTDHPRSSRQTSRGARIPIALPPAVSAEVRALAQQRGVTAFMLFVAVFQALLARYTGQLDLLIGTPIASRRRSEIENLIGFLTNTLVLRGNLTGNPSFAALLQTGREAALAAFAHQDLPFEKLVEELQPQRDLDRSPLIQVMFVNQNLPLLHMELAGLDLQFQPLPGGRAKFDLTLSLAESAEGFQGVIEYRSELFDPTTIRRYGNHFTALLVAGVSDPSRRLWDLSPLAAVERHQLQYAWNDNPKGSEDLDVHRGFEIQAARFPDTIAVVDQEHQLTYRSLDRWANRIARALQATGVGPDVKVGIAVERSPALIASLLGILKAGGGYVPLDHEYPRERLAFLLEDSRVGVLLTEEKLLHALPTWNGKMLTLEELSFSEDESTGPASLSLHPQNLAYVIYTSGTSGQPKGVMISHRSVGRRISYSLGVDYRRGDHCLQKTLLSFDISVVEIFGPLNIGATLVLARPGALDTEYLLDEIRLRRIRIASFPPAHYQALLEHGDLATCTSLSQLRSGGEALPAEIPHRFLRSMQIEFLNRYGPTEATVAVLSKRCTLADRQEGMTAIGRPLGQVKVYLLDCKLGFTPIGATGMLYVEGSCLSRGYLGRPALTAASFLPNPHDAYPGDRLYVTGDLARTTAEGEIEFLGRFDRQVKIRGFRIELEEIEAVLGRHPDVLQGAVVVQQGPGGDQQLVAHVVGTAALERRSLRKSLLDQLPPYMVPGFFVLHPSLPLMPNGKLNRAALEEFPFDAASGREDDAPLSAPSTPVEELVVQIWKETLGVEQVGLDADFFAVGGHSLSATRLASRLSQDFGLTVPLRVIFENPTVKGLVERIEESLSSGWIDALQPIERVRREGSLPLSFAQERLWFIHRMLDSAAADEESRSAPNAAYNIALAVRLEGSLNLAAVAASLRQIVARHEILRTSFRKMDGEPQQVISQAYELAVPLLDFSHLEPESAQRLILERCTAEALRPFDMVRLPLVRVLLLRQAEADHIVSLTLHHIVADGWSMGVLIREFATFYAAYLKKPASEAAPLPELPIQYADFAAWQRRWLEAKILEQELDWWSQELIGAPQVLELPTDRHRPPLQSFRGAAEPVHIPAAVSEKIEALAQQHRVTLFMTLLAAFNVLLARSSDQEDLLVGTPIAHRSRPETENLIGLFVNSVVIRGELGENPRFSQLLQRIRQRSLGAFAHQDVPFEKLVERLQLDRDPSRSPLFQVMFAFQNVPRERLELPDLTFEFLHPERQVSQVDLTLELTRGTEGIRGWLEYDTDLWDATSVGRWIRQWGTLLECLTEPSDPLISDLALLYPTEKHQALVEWNDLPTPQPISSTDPGTTLVDLWHRQARQTPESIALLIEDHHLSYRQLDRRSERVARALNSQGVTADHRVGLYVDRSLEMLIGLLGILKAGGVALPIDTTWPEDRLRLVLQDAEIKAVVTEQPLVTRLPTEGIRTLLVDAVLPPTAIPESGSGGLRPTNLAWVIYTSGSTGRPKGVGVSHRAALTHFQTLASTIDLDASDRVLQFTSLGFDAAFEEIFPPLLCGATLILRPARIWTAEEFWQIVKRERLTVADMPTSYWHHITPQSAPLPATLRLLMVGGEALRASTVTLWRSADPPTVRFLNAYGPTEAIITATVHDLNSGLRDGARVSLGRPLSGRRAYVLDRSGKPEPVGVPGELYLGASLARGYLHRPGLTAWRFLPDPFSGHAGARLYRTGDLARYSGQGTLEFMGRRDHQVKIRGFRVELEEIEAVCSRWAGSHSMVVAALPDQLDELRLVAYVVGSDQESLPLVELRQYLRRQLPEYMVPSAFVELDELPLTPNGKVDRRALPAPHWIDSKEYVAPRTPTEAALIRIWNEILGGERKIGIHDDFFELGGHSLLVIQLIDRLRQDLQVEIPVHLLFQLPTVAAFAGALELLRQGLDPKQATSRSLALDSELDPAIRPTSSPGPEPPTDLLLTGATGYLGAFLLAELLERTDARIHCLVRAPDRQSGADRIAENLGQYGLWRDAFQSRLQALPGDLARPFLGLEKKDFAELATRVDAIYHNGAMVHFTYPYEVLRPANVLGTLEVLRLACSGKTKPVHYISTLSVFVANQPENGIVTEGDEPADCSHLDAGYAQSKWVAERLVAEAGRRGLPVTIFRLGRVSGHSTTGISSTEDLFALGIKGCIQLGLVPILATPLDLTPVDYVSRAIVALSRQQETWGHRFHLVNPQAMSGSEFAQHLNASRFSLRPVPLEEWRRRFLDLSPEERAKNALHLFLPMIQELGTQRDQAEEPLFLNPSTLDALAGTDIVCPPADDHLLRRYLDYFVSCSFLPSPDLLASDASVSR